MICGVIISRNSPLRACFIIVPALPKMPLKFFCIFTIDPEFDLVCTRADEGSVRDPMVGGGGGDGVGGDGGGGGCGCIRTVDGGADWY